MFARYYGSGVGRFVTPDPLDVVRERFENPEAYANALMIPQAWNQYNYVRNNPLRYVDPDGEVAVEAVVVTSSMGGGIAISSASVAGLGLGVGAVGAGYGISWLGELFIINSVNKDLAKRATGKINRMWKEITKHPNFDPNDPRWQNVWKRLIAHAKEVRFYINNITNGALRQKLHQELIKVLAKASSHWGLSPHGACRDNRCEQPQADDDERGSMWPSHAPSRM